MRTLICRITQWGTADFDATVNQIFYNFINLTILSWHTDTEWVKLWSNFLIYIHESVRTSNSWFISLKRIKYFNQNVCNENVDEET